MRHMRFLFEFCILVFVLQLFSQQRAEAYYIDTGVSDPCHEKMTAEMLLNFLEKYPDVAMDIPLPESNLWEMYADAIFEKFQFPKLHPSQKYFISSLLIGTRWPDEHGRSVTSLASLYDTHGDPDDQQEHFLRRLEHDFDTGNVVAMSAAKDFIHARIDKAFALMSKPKNQQIVSITEYVEFYGQISLRLWGPAYHVGVAIHTLQDSFSHTVRTDDLHRIVHVMNFLDAVTDDDDIHRDGLAHSFGMDECSARNEPIYTAAREAASELVEIFVYHDPQIFLDVEDEWLMYTPGCDVDNHFCDSIWYSHVTSDPTGPIVGCTYTDSVTASRGLLALLTGIFF
ncbi:MAG: hypothetical protein JXR76_32380 [Deltaproteobacteria bacterium]|nr:hypothetical protein [Deltaproteobacteria bacterium]